MVPFSSYFWGRCLGSYLWNAVSTPCIYERSHRLKPLEDFQNLQKTSSKQPTIYRGKTAEPARPQKIKHYYTGQNHTPKHLPYLSTGLIAMDQTRSSVWMVCKHCPSRPEAKGHTWKQERRCSRWHCLGLRCGMSVPGRQGRGMESPFCPANAELGGAEEPSQPLAHRLET